jgi:mono/diheme cytochrome c family protein
MRRFLLTCALLATAACHPQDIDPLEQQPKYKAYQDNNFFDDKRSMRLPPEGTVARERKLEEEGAPTAITAPMLELGRESYDRTCAICHGLAGDSDTVIAGKMGLHPPPSLHEERIRNMPAEQIYKIMTEGYGLMARYATVLTPHERWATIAYIRALQLSQHLPASEAPEDVLRRLGVMK